jgi:hypothetical protein
MTQITGQQAAFLVLHVLCNREHERGMFPRYEYDSEVFDPSWE